MFTVIIEFKNGLKRLIFNNVNKCTSEDLYEKYMALPEVSYVGILDERN